MPGSRVRNVVGDHKVVGMPRAQLRESLITNRGCGRGELRPLRSSKVGRSQADSTTRHDRGSRVHNHTCVGIYPLDPVMGKAVQHGEDAFLIQFEGESVINAHPVTEKVTGFDS